MEGAVLNYLLDTAPWINGVTLPEVFPPRVREILKSEGEKGLCSVSLLEAAILYRLRRLDLESSLQEFLSVALAPDLRILELTPLIATKTNELSSEFPGDPFDRTIVATASVLGLTLITADPAIRDEEACAVEFYPYRPSRRGR